MQQWLEKSWEEWMSEWDLIVMLIDRNLVREAAENAVVEIGKRWLKVSVIFSFLIFGSLLVLGGEQ